MYSSAEQIILVVLMDFFKLTVPMKCKHDTVELITCWVSTMTRTYKSCCANCAFFQFKHDENKKPTILCSMHQ